MSRFYSWLLGAVLAGMLAACATTASFEQRVAVGYQTNTTIRQSTTTLLQAGKLSSSAAERVLAITDDARKMLDSAQANKDQASLNIALKVLESVQGELK